MRMLSALALCMLQLQMDGVTLILCSFLMAGMCMNIIIVNLSRYKIRRFYGVITITFYIIFITTAILTELGVLLGSWEQKRVVKWDDW